MIKLKIIFLSFILLFIAMICKLFYLQVLNHTTSDSDYTTTRKIYPERGKIYDRNKLPLAANQLQYLLFAEPKLIKDKDSIIKKVNDVLQVGEATLEARLDMSKQWVALLHGVTKDQKEKLLKAVPQGLGFDEQSVRYYPEASLSAHILGFVGKNTQGEDVGNYGLEGYYDQQLVGLPGLEKSDRDLAGNPIFIGTQEMLNPQPGSDLVLTIDKSVQSIVKEKLKEGIDYSSAKDGCAIAVDPNTMEVLAASCLPDFDPTHYNDYPADVFRNPLISDIYEPGSTFKPIVMGAALQEGVLKPDSTFNEETGVKIGDYTITNYDHTGEGKITMTHVLEKSSNIGMVYVEGKLGNDKFYQYLKKYGLGQLTGIDLQGESPATLKDQKDWYPIDFATAAFGQGIGITRMQLVTALAAVINGGKLMKPYIVKEVINGDEHKVRQPEMVRQVLSPKVSAEMRKMLVSVVDYNEQHITWDVPPGYVIGGKTGTAQVAIAGHYDPNKTIASFMGFFPADKPKVLILVVLRNPGLSGFGSTTAAPIFWAITNQLLSYYNIPPTQ
jgi:cell division protein FtsI/penicillin-binding protein 2